MSEAMAVVPAAMNNAVAICPRPIGSIADDCENESIKTADTRTTRVATRPHSGVDQFSPAQFSSLYVLNQVCRPRSGIASISDGPVVGEGECQTDTDIQAFVRAGRLHRQTWIMADRTDPNASDGIWLKCMWKSPHAQIVRASARGAGWGK